MNKYAFVSCGDTITTKLARSRLALDIWYELLWWFVYDFTANKTAKEVKLPQKLVHRCFFTIRNRRSEKREKLRRVNAVKRGRGAKTLLQPVFGIYQRNGTVYVKFVKDTGKKTLQKIIKGKIVLESDVYSDTWTAYDGLKKKGYKHETIDHGNKEYFKKKENKKIHINGIEGFWGYMKEQEFRFNYRNLSTEEMVAKIIKILVKSAPLND
ncbi:MAG: hypothetical protein COT67_02665 [Candidatus Tagabacteria bacterium CG09_land_8_20_14_0_10_41_14]|uniref:ISXO2-like transposase domain-containing protein n=2 Tax=Candidatus Tagaibacteriota TaxID=1817918 RepID=A0A2H0WKX3_9BACT|nr:MAG: hypothetical protein COT67_02665 [Candidatus Tagabacteria bacterium CG09_land_8_20_14_0_10_41_14]PJE72998.1 MAG: hypothetical protein COV00_02275 [Candidatus Tagabacteria bacterium CG10_big_fil_rev_8_21_14_0_10_40_13]